MQTYQKALNNLIELVSVDGYLINNDIVDVSIDYKLGLSATNKLASDLRSRNILIYDKEPDEKSGTEYDSSQLDYEKIFSDVIEVAPGLLQFVDYVREITPPQHGEWSKLILHAQNKNEYAYNRIFEMYLRTVVNIANDFYNRYGASLEDCIQEGCIGLMTAIEKFDNRSGRNFRRYFPLYIIQNIQRETALVSNPTMRLPTYYHTEVLKAFELSQSHGCGQCARNAICSILITDVALELECTEKEAERYLISSLPTANIEDYYTESYSSAVADADFCLAVEQRSNSIEILKALTKLNERERKVIAYRFGLFGNESLTLEEAGKIFGVTRERVRQIESKALRKLRDQKFVLGTWGI